MCEDHLSPSRQHSQDFLSIFCPKGIKLMVYQQQARTCIIKNKKTSPLICVATAITIVRMIDSTYTIEGMILLFLVISLRWPDGVERKQLPAMLSTWPSEYRTAKAVTLKLDSTNTSVMMKDSRKPAIEHPSQPIMRVLQERSPQRVFYLPKLKRSLSLPLSPVAQSKALPMRELYDYDSWYNSWYNQFEFGMDMRKLIDETDFQNLNELTRRWKKDSNASSLAHSQLSQRSEHLASNQTSSEQQLALKENIYHQPQAEDRVASEQLRKRQVMPQIIDEDTEHFRNRLQHLLNGFKTDAVSEFMSMKKAMLDYQKQSIKNDTHKYLSMYEEKHQELLSAKEKLGTLTAETEKKTMQIELMSSHIAKLNQRIKVTQHLSRPFALLYQNKVSEKVIKVKMQQATTYDNRRTAIKGFSGWRNVYREGKKEQETAMVENRVELQVREVVGRFQKEIEMLKQKLNESTRKNIQYEKNMHLMQDNLKKAFLRGLSSMNMEAMTLFTNTQEGQLQNSHYNEDFVSSRQMPEDNLSVQKSLNNNRGMMNQSRQVSNHSNVFVNKPKVESKDHKWKEAPIMGVQEKVESEEPRPHTIKPTITEGKVIKIVDGKSSVEASSQKQIGKKVGLTNSGLTNKIEASRKK